MWSRAELKEKAKADFKRSYWPLVLVAFIYSFISGGGGSAGGSSSSSSSDSLGGMGAGSGVDTSFLVGIAVVVLIIVLAALIFGIVISTFGFNPVLVGVQRFHIEAAHRQMTINDFGKLFCVFKNGVYMNVVKIMFLKNMYVFLWSLLFIIPGIIKSYEYYMVPYILAENPNLSSEEVFRLSKEMMDNNKWDTFVLQLSFFGWYLLAIFTCGLLAIFYVNPYMNMTLANLYEAVKAKASIAYFDPELDRNNYSSAPAYAYGNPGAYSTYNNYDYNINNPADTFWDNYNAPEEIKPEEMPKDSYDNPYQMPGEDE